MRTFLFLFLCLTAFGQYKTTDVGIRLIKQYESFQPKAYKCPASVWTIGYGHTGGVSAGMIITERQAIVLLKKDVGRFERHIRTRVFRTLKWHEFDALVGFTYNVGYRIRGQLSTFINSGDTKSAILKMGRYNRARINGKLRVLKGLVRRRKTEALLYSSGILKFTF